MRRWDRLAEGYLSECEARGLAPQTLERMAGEVDRWGSWLKRRRPRPSLDEIDADLITRYLTGRASFRAKSTLASILGVMRGMGDYLVREGVWVSSPLRWMKGPKIDPRRLSPRRIGRESMEALWRSGASYGRGYHRYQWLAVMGLLYGTGLRRGELERLDLSDWDRESSTLWIDGRKSGRERRAAVPPLAWRCLGAYLPHRQNHLETLGLIEQRALFVNRDGGRLAGHAISRALKSMARRAGIGHVTMHQFRHSCASDLLEDGVRLVEVQRVLGHAQISTTVRYVHVADPARREAVALHPINRMLGREVAA